ncbi:gamma-mobile-trio recombinase GmtY [Acinetobacter nosocomialis]|uniref:gamma-mobile-trio recombinase GmtY n=1 Tax=Acinetobacter nosocomialis TaxID=106654 RepID=UPI0026F43B9C|nr:gamma-mobile-trio recombinase GmtY [Acinetobacter nosocomialis]MDO7435686.1 gamma-mobile-trio recombinase GmtY [Acinetobacter nosocomialis]
MEIIKINATIKLNNELFIMPILIDGKFNLIIPVFEYSLYLHNIDKSESTIKNFVKAAELLYLYINVAKNKYENLQNLFESFVQILYSGTIDENLDDPLLLYWFPLSRNVANIYLQSLNGFGDWIVDKYGFDQLNPIKKIINNNDVRKIAALFHYNKNSFLGHLKHPNHDLNNLAARTIMGKPNILTTNTNVIEFPDEKFNQLLIDGVGKCKNINVKLRDTLILLLLHGAGLRESEALHLWIHDVKIVEENIQNNTINQNKLVAKIKIFHPEEGRAPNGWKSIDGFNTRKHYLREKYNLKPRNTLHGKDRVGFKTRAFRNKGNYFDIYFFPWFYGEMFAEIWKIYLISRANIDDTHPYAFVNFEEGNLGKPYKLSTFNNNYKKYLKRIGLNQSYEEGYCPHAHRHSYAKRLRRHNIDNETIRITMHHSSLISQEMYTQPTSIEITKILNDLSAK